MTPLFAVPAALLVAALIAVWLRWRLTEPARRGGDRLMRGRAANQLRFMSQTLLVRADPRTVAAIVGPAVGLRPTLFVVAEPEGAEVAAWTSTSSLTPDLPRLVVRPAETAGWTEFGVVRFAWWSRFPQGGLFVKRVVPQSLAALEAAGLEVLARVREFDPPFPGATWDGPRTAVPFGTAGPGNSALSAD